ncbi:hypothetical protein LXL04_029664 [Taraxacum kok-saghyz]
MDSGVTRVEPVRPDWRSEPLNPDSGVVDKTSGVDSDSRSNPMNFQGGFNESVQNPIINPSFDDFVSDYYTDEKLKELVLEKLELLYNEAIGKLVSMGYDERVALEAILMNGHCHGNSDPLTNILHNTQHFLTTEANGNTKKVFRDLKQLIEVSLISLVCLLRRNNPSSSIRDVMCCLLLSDFHVVHPFSMKISDASIPNDDGDDDDAHPIWSEPTPSMLVLLKDHAAFLAEEYKRLEKAIDDRSDGDSSSDEVENDSEVSLEVLRLKNQETTKSILMKFQDMNLEDQKDETLLSLVNEMKDLEIQVEERKKWAEEKAVQVAKRLCDDRNKLKKLKMLREDNEQMRKHEKSILDIDHPTMKSLIDVEMTLRQKSAQVDRARVVVSCLELENMEMKAETEAAKLSASESMTQRLEAAKREKKHLKKISAWEKQRCKMQEEIALEKQKLLDLEYEMLQVEAANKAAEAKWREKQESKKHALARVKQERHLKKQTESNVKRTHESLRAKIDLDFKCHKDDMQRLEQELSRAKSLTDPDNDLTIGKRLHGSADEDDDDDDDEADAVDHECVMCQENEVSVLFLPCAHEVVCVGCNEELKKDECPSCGEAIEQRIRVFGGSS